MAKNLLLRIGTVFAIVVVLLPLIAPAAASTLQGHSSILSYNKPFIHPLLLREEFWSQGYVALGDSLVGKLSSTVRTVAKLLGLRVESDGGNNYARLLLILPPDMDVKSVIELLRGKVTAILNVFPTHAYTIVSVIASKKELTKLVNEHGIIAVLPDLELTFLSLRSKVLEEVEGFPASLKDKLLEADLQRNIELLQTSGGVPFHYTVNITGAAKVWELGITGDNATIAIIDTGVDYSSAGLGYDALARDEYGYPLILEDTAGLILFSVPASSVTGNTAEFNVAEMYYYLPFYVWWGYGVVVKDYRGFVYVSIGDCENSTEYELPSNWTIPDDAVGTPSTPPRLGMLVEVVFVPLGVIIYTVPGIAADRDGDGYYDSIYFDLSTAYYYLGQSLSACGIDVAGLPAEADFSFADEQPVYYFGGEIVARDFDGDGYLDFSVGTLAGYYYDTGIVLLEYLGVLPEVMKTVDLGDAIGIEVLREWFTEDIVGGIWPGFDVEGGRWAAIHYDFHSHGTFCATTAAGRPVPFIDYTGEGVMAIVGQAPGAKIAAANALFAGDVATALYFFSGFDLVTPYGYAYLQSIWKHSWVERSGYVWGWRYTGQHKVDITSNSWGISGWILWGWGSGVDPISIVVDFTTLATGTAHFIAVGNGGPGWGTVTSPGAATLGIGVGAATEFTYRPMYGYLPGGNREVVSWSNRGPASTGVAKPDIVAIGSFAFAVGRVWESLGYGMLTGLPWLQVDLFGGTSQATPMTAGVAALVVSAYKTVYGKPLEAPRLKTILMNSAVDMGFNALSQGAGFVNAVKAVEKALGLSPIVYAEPSYFVEAYREATGYRILTSWYEPKVVVYGMPGEAKEFRLVVEDATRVRVYALTFNVKPVMTFTRVIDLGGLGSNAILPVAVFEASRLSRFNYIEIVGTLHYRFYDPIGRGIEHANAVGGVLAYGLELWYWIDFNRDNVIQFNETARIQYDIRGGNQLHIQVAKLGDQIREIHRLVETIIGLDPDDYPRRFVLVFRVFGNEWSGEPVKARLSIIVYAGYVKPIPLSITYARADGKLLIKAKMVLPKRPGLYEGYIVVYDIGGREKIIIPFTVNVYAVVNRAKLVLNPSTRDYSLYSNFYLRGVEDFLWRYETGDWRFIKVFVKDASVKMLVVEVTWPKSRVSIDYTSNIDVAVLGPSRYYFVVDEGPAATTTVLNGVLLGGELTHPEDWEMKAYWDSPAPGVSRIIVPVDGPGVYTVVVRNIQFSGERVAEPIRVTIYPVVGYVYGSTVRAGGSSYVIMSLRTYTTLLKLVDPIPPLDTVYVNTSGMYYATLEDVDISVVKAYTISRGYVQKLIMFLKTSKSTPAGLYTVPVAATASLPVYTIGWYKAGDLAVTYESGDIALLATIRIIG